MDKLLNIKCPLHPRNELVERHGYIHCPSCQISRDIAKKMDNAKRDMDLVRNHKSKYNGFWDLL